VLPQAREDAACEPKEVVAEQELRAAEGAGQPCNPQSMPDSAAHMASPPRAAEASGAVQLRCGNRFPLDGWGPPFLLLRPRTGCRAAQRDGRKSARQMPASRSARARQRSNPGEAHAQAPKRACVLDADAAAGGPDAAGAVHVKSAVLLRHDAVIFLASGGQAEHGRGFVGVGTELCPGTDQLVGHVNTMCLCGGRRALHERWSCPVSDGEHDSVLCQATSAGTMPRQLW